MRELQQHILGLSVPERLQLISFIAASISEEAVKESFQVPAEWLEEASLRVQKAQSGETPTYTWDEVKQQLHDRK